MSTEATLPWYSDAEVDDLCTGLKNNAAKVRRLRSMGLTVNTKPNGRPLLMRNHAELTLSGAKAAQAAIDTAAKSSAEPDASALVLQFKKQRA